MQKVLERLNEEDRLTVLLFGGGAVEKERLASWAASYEICISVAGSFSFAEELRIISNLELMVAMDSGNAHLAAMYGSRPLRYGALPIPMRDFIPLPSHRKMHSCRIVYGILYYPHRFMGTKRFPAMAKR